MCELNNIADIIRLVREALDARVPAAPFDVCWIGDADHFAGVCPVCKAWVNSEQQHCPGCGQALTWEEVEHGID